MISLIQSHTSGNAIRILLSPPATATSWKLLRKTSDTFTGASDPDAIVVFNGKERHILDLLGLLNGETVYYRVYYFSGVTLLSTSATMSATASSSFILNSEDASSIVRDRLDLGLQGLLARGLITHPNNLIPVMIASPLVEETLMPVVTVHMASETSESRFIGDDMGLDDGDSVYGWFSRYQLDIIGWSLNSDQRKIVRNAIKHILIANSDVFDYYGFESIDLQFSDHEDFQTYNAPMYTTNCTMRFLAVSSIAVPHTGAPIANIISTLTI